MQFGEPVIYRSSPIAIRSHCGTCGTPLQLAYDGSENVALTAGSFDSPATLTPTHHYGVEGRLPWADISPELPAQATRERW